MTVLVHQLRIRGFKALLDVHLELGVVNVFIGPNGSGKSSLLEALGLLSAAAAGRVDHEALLRRGVRLGHPAVYKTALRAPRVPRFIQLEAQDATYRYRVSLDNPIERPGKAWRFASEWFGHIESDKPLVGRSPRSRDVDPLQGVWATAPLPPQAQPFREALRGYRIFTPQTPMLRGMTPDPSAEDPLGLHGGGLAAAVERWFQQDPAARTWVLDTLRAWFDWVDALKVAPVSSRLVPPKLAFTSRVLVFTDRYSRPGRNQMSAYDASEGVLHALFLLTLAAHPEAPALAAVDNVGYGLHPRLKRALMAAVADRLLEQSQRQLLLTTHDPLLLDGLPLLDERVRLFAVDRGPQGQVLVQRVTVDPDLWAQKEARGWALSDLWVEGWLGGVPNVW